MDHNGPIGSFQCIWGLMGVHTLMDTNDIHRQEFVLCAPISAQTESDFLGYYHWIQMGFILCVSMIIR